MLNKITEEQAALAMAACINNAEALKIDAELLMKSQRYPRAFALYHCACEELAKFYMLEIIGKKLRTGLPINWKRFWKRFRNHDSKMAQAGARAAAYSSYATPELKLRADAASISWLFSGIQPRNRSLYVELEDDGRLSAPDDVNWEKRIDLLSALLDLLFRASVDVGHDQPTILALFGEPSKADAEKTLLRAVALQYLFTDMTPEQAHEKLEKLWAQASTEAN